MSLERVEHLRAFPQPALDTGSSANAHPNLYVEESEPDAGRLTRDIDIVVRREDLQAIAKAIESFGLRYRRVASAPTG